MTNQPQPSGTLRLSDTDYKYGVGPIACRVTRVIEPQSFGDGVIWWRVLGDCAQGTPEHHGEWRERELYIREPAFAQVVRH